MSITVASVIAVVVLALLAALLVYRKKMGGRPVPAALRPGQTLPRFTAVDEHGNALDSSSLKGAPAVILFVRGSWCPFCSRQVSNLTTHYKTINELGARLVLITPKPLETTRRVAEFFEVDFVFWLDEDLAIAEQLGLMLPRGVPSDYRGEYGDNTLWPTSLVVDAEGVIRFASVSKFIADRPNPQKFVQVLQSL